jgi:uncharacterized membrane protein
MKKIINKISIILIILGIFIPGVSFARDYVSDWYIKDFESEIIVNKDSSLTITEMIIADCGNLPDKHGIFRILPTQTKTTEGVIYNPVELISIADFYGNSLKYTTTRSAKDHTITWKIGDPNITVQGENYYKIKYKVKNVIRFDNPEFDELYWNLNGNFWDIETDNFEAMIFFPQGINKETEGVEVEYYAGTLGSKEKDLANYEWSKNILHFWSTQTIPTRQGITVSVTLPKNNFIPYKLTVLDKYGDYLGWLNIWLLLPVFVFIVCFVLWKKYGDDPNLKKTVIPEFEIPENLSPVYMGGLMRNGRFENKLTTATLIDLAVRGFISIKEIEGSFLKKKDYELKLLKENYIENKEFSEIEKAILNWLLMGRTEISLSEIKKEHMAERKTMFLEVTKILKNDLTAKELITKKGLLFQGIFFGIGLVVWFIMGAFHFASVPIIISAVILIVFSFIMPKRTQKGAELLWRIKGFKLYMNTAEKYRQQFYEKENIFEKFLPYAIVFGITKEWVKKMQDIYGGEYFKTHIPAWYVGANIASFNADSFSSAMSSLSSSISSNVGSASGAGGAGGAGGGGGGGGGGGW